MKRRYRYGKRSENDEEVEQDKTKLRKKSSKRTVKTVPVPKLRIPSVDNEDTTIPWFQKYEPRSILEVALHKRKLNDVTESLDNMLSKNSDTRILLLTGPSGCSKSTIIKQLAHSLIPKYRRFQRNLMTLSSRQSTSPDYIEYVSDLSMNGTQQSSNFKEFLNNCKYRIGSNMSLILVEDFPNVFHNETRRIFQNALMEWLYCDNEQLPPLVLCLSECEIDTDNPRGNSFSVDNMYTAETIIGREILNDPRVERIKFNPISMTLTKKTLNIIANNEKHTLQKNGKWVHKNKFINELSQNCGDIRASIYALEFWATTNIELEMTIRKQPPSYFHAIGKIMYGSKEIPDDNKMINLLMSSTSGIVSNSSFKLGLLENYENFNKGKFDIKSACKITDALSESDLGISINENLEYGIRKVRNTFHDFKTELGISESQNSQGYHGRTNFPVEWKLNKSIKTFNIESEEYFNIELYKYNAVTSNRDIELTYGYYGPLIRKQLLYKKNSMIHYLRTLPTDQQIKLKQGKQDILGVEDDIDMVNRLGGPLTNNELDRSELGSAGSDIQESNKTFETLQYKKRSKIQKLIERHSEAMSNRHSLKLANLDEEDRAMLNDVIENSEEEEGDDDIDEFDNDADDSMYEMLSQRAPKRSPEKTSIGEKTPTINESLSDSDLELL
mgnify:CR=1 FL=1